MGVLMKKIVILALLFSTNLMAQTPSPTVRICDENGCSERPRDAVTFNPAVAGDSAADQQAAKLIALAEKDPRAAYDLGLRYFRGDGVRQDSYQALKWMRDAAERGFLKAQTAVGRFYLMGLEEMGSDPAEAEKCFPLPPDAVTRRRDPCWLRRERQSRMRSLTGVGWIPSGLSGTATGWNATNMNGNGATGAGMTIGPTATAPVTE